MTEPTASQLSSKYDPHEVETAVWELWERGDYFKADPAAPGEPFSIVIPPPNVTGFLHIGHALNNTLQDILTRWRRMQGRNVLWVPGTDHAGIATQHVVERNLREKEQLDRREMGREAFLARVWAWKEQYGSRIVSQLKRVGCSADWSRERFTMDAGLSRAVLTVFKQLFDEGLIYQGDYLVNWSPKLQTALSDDEVEHREVQGHLWHYSYPLVDGSGFLTVATTRPETMLGDTAVAVNPEDERYAALIGKHVRLPLTERTIPIIGDAFVDRSFGTGVVKVTPAHDPNDYEMGKRHGLEFINLLNPDGTLNENAGKFAGLEAKEARKRVVAELEAQGLMVKIEDYTHSVGHCYRSGCVIEPYMSKQWFVRMKELCGPAIDAVREKKIEFVPQHHEKTYFHWLENVRDWAISRQLWWGHRIPVFFCDACGHVWCEIDEAPKACAKCASVEVRQDPDVLDTWFSSALWPFSTLGWPYHTADLKKYYPTSVLVTGADIIFFWVARMIIMGIKFMGEIPFHKVVINPIVRDEHGKKMSKSTGNAIDPLEVIEEIGADSIRMTLASYPTQTSHISLAPKKLESFRNFNNKLWNAARFVLMNTEDLSPEALAAEINPNELLLEDRWILAELAGAIERSNAALEGFLFDQYVDEVYKFTWNRYCDWYLELVKDRLYAKDGGEGRLAPASRLTAQRVLVRVLESVVRLMHPGAPYITETLWQDMKARWGGISAPAGSTSLFSAPALIVAPWPETPSGDFRDAAAQIELVQEVIGRIRNIRGEMSVPPGLAIEVEIVTENAPRRDILAAQAHFIRNLANVGALSVEPFTKQVRFAATNVFEDLTINVFVPQELLTAERQRLEKQIAKIEKGVEGAERKLANQNFVASAPVEVVAAERERLDKMNQELDSLREKLKSLAEG